MKVLNFGDLEILEPNGGRLDYLSETEVVTKCYVGTLSPPSSPEKMKKKRVVAGMTSFNNGLLSALIDSKKRWRLYCKKLEDLGR